MKPKMQARLKWAVMGAVALMILLALAVSISPPSRPESQISSMVVVHEYGLYDEQVTAGGSVLNNSLRFHSGDRIGVKIALVYTPGYGDPGSIKISSVNDSDGFEVSNVSPALPVILTGSPQGIVMTVVLLAPSSSYSGDLHVNVIFSLPPPPP